MALAIAEYKANAGIGGTNLLRFEYAITFYGNDVSAEIAVAKQVEVEISLSNSFTNAQLANALQAAIREVAKPLGITVTTIWMFSFDTIAATETAYIMSLDPSIWLRFGYSITSSGGFVSLWGDQSGKSHHLVQNTATNQPALQGDGSILFDGIDNYMKCPAFTLNQPTTHYVLMKQITWVSNDYLWDGDTLGTTSVVQISTTPELTIGTGVSSKALTLDTYGIVTSLMNGASSVFSINNLTPVTGTCTSLNPGGFTLGSAGNQVSFANMQVKEVLVFAYAHDAATRANVIAYLAGVGGLSI